MIVFLLLLRIIYAYGEATTEGLTWKWINPLLKKPAKYHFWREIVENMGRRLELALLYFLFFKWTGLLYFLLIEIAAMSIYELRIRQVIYGTWLYEKQDFYYIKIAGKTISFKYPSTKVIVFLAVFPIILIPFIYFFR